MLKWDSKGYCLMFFKYQRHPIANHLTYASFNSNNNKKQTNQSKQRSEKDLSKFSEEKQRFLCKIDILLIGCCMFFMYLNDTPTHPLLPIPSSG